MNISSIWTGQVQYHITLEWIFVEMMIDLYNLPRSNALKRYVIHSPGCLVTNQTRI